MIGPDQIERAERVLQVIYGIPASDLSRQLASLEVDREAFAQFLEHRKMTVARNYREAWARIDPRLHPALNTLLQHFFLVGVVCGRNEAKVIE